MTEAPTAVEGGQLVTPEGDTATDPESITTWNARDKTYKISEMTDIHLIRTLRRLEPKRETMSGIPARSFDALLHESALRGLCLKAPLALGVARRMAKNFINRNRQAADPIGEENLEEHALFDDNV